MQPFRSRIQHKILFPVLAILAAMLAATLVYVSGQSKQDLLDNARTEGLSTAQIVAVTLWRTLHVTRDEEQQDVSRKKYTARNAEPVCDGSIVEVTRT